jgi:hypothetical protein
MPSPSYLKRIGRADVFIVYDSVQRVERGYENRNKLKDGKWLTIPVTSSSRALIMDTSIAGLEWIEQHKNKIKSLYGLKSLPKVVEEYYDTFTSLDYKNCLTEALMVLMEHMGIKTQVVFASNLDHVTNGGVDQLVKLTKLAGCDTYLSGPTCLTYGLTHDVAHAKGIRLEVDTPPKEYGLFHYLIEEQNYL